jgi:hypothetical protein
MGEVGWALGAIGWAGIAVAVVRQTRKDILLLGLTVLYPIADALTYYDAPSNSLRGLTGSVIWAVWVAIGIHQIARIRSRSIGAALIGVTSVAVAIQLALFAGFYFREYSVQYAYAYETGYDGIYGSLQQRGLQTMPITLHAGYQRGAILEYFSRYRLRANDSELACFDLPDSLLHEAVLPRVFIIREDRGFAATPGCVDQTKLIERDKNALLKASPPSGVDSRRLDVIAVFANDPQGDYYTAILLLHH